MATEDRIYFARRAAEEQERAIGSADPDVAESASQDCSAPISNARASATGRKRQNETIG